MRISGVAHAFALVGLGLLAACASTDRAGEPSGAVEQASTSVCPTATVEGIDVSAGQGTIDWATVKQSGRAFAFIKATQGDYYTSSHFTDQWSGAKAAGLLRSPYHFFDPTVDGVAQAKFFLGVVGALGPGDLPPMLDIECPTASTPDASQSNCEHSSDSGWVDATTLNQRVHDWLDYVAQATGRVPIVYSYNYWFQDSGMDSTTLVGKYPFYVSSPSTNGCFTVGLGNAFTTATFWQWSVTGTCPGVTGTVDLDRFVGTLEDLRHLANLDIDAGATADGGASDAASSGDASFAADAADAAHDADPNIPIVVAAVSGDQGGCAIGRASGVRGAWLLALVAMACARRRRA